MTKFEAPGAILTLTAPSGGVSSDEVVQVGSIVGVVVADAAEGETMEVAVIGVHNNLPCLGTDVIAEGSPLYWDDGNSRFTLTSATGLILCAVAVAASGSGNALVTAKLTGGVAIPVPA